MNGRAVTERPYSERRAEEKRKAGEWGKQRQDLDLLERERSAVKKRPKLLLSNALKTIPTKQQHTINTCTHAQVKVQDRSNDQSPGPGPQEATKPMPISPPPPIYLKSRPDHHQCEVDSSILLHLDPYFQTHNHKNRKSRIAMPSTSSSSASPAAAVHSHHANNSWQDKSTRHAKKVVVIGAGPAGVHAAARLRAQGFTDISIFEAGCAVGGRCVSRVMHEGSVPVEAGFLANIVSEARNPLAERVVRRGGKEGGMEVSRRRTGEVGSF